MAILYKCSQRKKEEGEEEEDLEFALIDRRPRSCAEAPVKNRFNWGHYESYGFDLAS